MSLRPQTGDYSVYWIHWSDNTDPHTQGYVGISMRPEIRLQEHIRGDQYKVQKCLRSGGVMTILKSGLTEEQAIAEEKKLRPLPHIGLNIVEGGGLPPVRWGHVKSKHEVKALKEAARRSWARDREMRVEALRNVGEETRRKRSVNAKRQHAEGRIRTIKGHKYPKVGCIDCRRVVSVNVLPRHKCIEEIK